MGWLDKYQEGGDVDSLMTPELLMRQAFVESSFKPKQSTAGAQGLTQFTPITIKELKRLKLIGSDFDIHDNKQAVDAQKKYMDYLYNRPWINKEQQSDSIRMAKTLAAYNYGPNNTIKFLNEQKKKGEDIYKSMDWLEDLPGETEDYVNMVLRKENTEGRPMVQENFEKAKTSSKYKPITDLYKFQSGGVIEDDRGQWAHPGKITKINSNNITMKGVNYPVLGISDTGDKQLMNPGGEYHFEGKSVTEIPLESFKCGGKMKKYK